MLFFLDHAITLPVCESLLTAIESIGRFQSSLLEGHKSQRYQALNSSVQKADR